MNTRAKTTRRLRTSGATTTAVTDEDAVPRQTSYSPQGTPPQIGAVTSNRSQCPAELCIFTLGSVRIFQGDYLFTTADWKYSRTRELLIYLLDHPPQTREQIALAFWPDAPRSKQREKLRDHIYDVRQMLGRTDWVVFENGVYALNRDLSYWYDVEEFEAKAQEGQLRKADDPRRAMWLLERAIELYGGEFLDDMIMFDWASARREELKQTFLEALLTRGELLFKEGRYSEAEEAYRQSIAEDPYVEEAHRELMRCLARQGEYLQAIRVYKQLEGLVTRLGGSLAPETKQLYARLCRSEPI